MPSVSILSIWGTILGRKIQSGKYLESENYYSSKKPLSSTSSESVLVLPLMLHSGLMVQDVRRLQDKTVAINGISGEDLTNVKRVSGRRCPVSTVYKAVTLSFPTSSELRSLCFVATFLGKVTYCVLFSSRERKTSGWRVNHKSLW